MALSDIQTKALALILDTENVSSDDVLEWIQKGQREAEDRYGFIPMEVGDLSMTTNAAGLLHAIGDKTPSSVRWARRRARPYYVAGDGRTIEMDWLDPGDELRRRYDPEDTTQVGAPRHLVETESAFEVYPLADGQNPVGAVYSDGEYRIHAPYYQRFATLTNPTDTNWLTENGGSDYLAWFAASEGLLFNRDREEALSARAIAESQLRRLIRLDKRSRFTGGGFTLGVYPGPYAERG